LVDEADGHPEQVQVLELEQVARDEPKVGERPAGDLQIGWEGSR
jgi:hypothetical protein